MLFDFGYFKMQALTRLAAAGAYFFTRLKQQTKSCAADAGGRQHVELAQVLHAVEGDLSAKQICIGAKALVPSRLVAGRMPEAIVKERRRMAKKNAKKKGSVVENGMMAI